MLDQLDLFLDMVPAVVRANPAEGCGPAAKVMPPPTLGRVDSLQMARVYLSQARHARLQAANRGYRSWVATLLGWASINRLAAYSLERKK